MRQQLGVILPAMLLLSCLSPPLVGSVRPWAGASDFIEVLRCDMTPEEVSEQARDFARLHLHQPEGREELLVAQKGDTLIHLELEGLRLKAYQISWTSGLTQQSCALKADLCSGQKLVELQIVADPADAGAAVLLDGAPVGALSSQGTKSIDVPLGSHELEIQRAGVSSWRTRLHYASSSPGCDRLTLPGDALQPSEVAETFA